MSTNSKSSPGKKQQNKQSSKAPVRKSSTSKRRISVKQDTAIDENTLRQAESKSKAEITRFTLDPVLNINTVETLKHELSQLAAQQDMIVIDASSVEMTDTACFQVLLAFVRQLSNQDRKPDWENPSEKFLSNANTLGLTSLLGL